MVYNRDMHLKRFLLTVFSFVFIVGQFAITFPVSAQDITGDSLISAVNDLRKTKGLGELQSNPQLMAAAQAQADYLAANFDIDKKDADIHVGDRGTLPHDRAYQYGYSLNKQFDLVENSVVLPASMTLDRVITNDWWKTTYAQKNFLDGWGVTYLDIGVGIATKGLLIYYVIDIGASKDTPGAVVVTNEAGDQYSFVPVETAAPNPDGSIIHIVKEGESLSVIALSYGVSMAQIETLNNLAGKTGVITNQRLIIKNPDSGTPYSPPEATKPPTATWTPVATYTPRPKVTMTPSPTSVPPTITPTIVKTPVESPVSLPFVGGILVILLGIGLIVVLYFMLKKRR
jgi:LysM repeat protein